MSASTPYVVYGANNWDHRWIAEAHLAHALAKRHRVLYVDPPMSPLTPLGERSHLQWADLLARGMHEDGGVAILKPLVLPPVSHPRSRALSKPLIRRQVRRAARRLGLEGSIVIAAGGLDDLAGAVDERLSIFLMQDWFLGGEGPELIGIDPALAAAADIASCNAADLICVVSPALRQALEQRGWESQLLRHGFDTELVPLYDRAEMPADYTELARPLIGCVGSIDARLDFAALGAVAERFSRGSLVLVGAVSPRLDRAALDELLKRPNVHHIPFRPRKRLPAYVRHLDCGLMPYRPTEFARYGAPSKLWEYLYSGGPIVGMGYPDLLSFPPPLVHFADSAAEFPELVAAALEQDSHEARRARREFALANSWDTRAAELERLVASRLEAGALGALAS